MQSTQDRIIIGFLTLFLAWTIGLIPFIAIIYFIEDPMQLILNLLLYGAIPTTIGLLIIMSGKTIRYRLKDKK